jgi:hypothetical protein
LYNDLKQLIYWPRAGGIFIYLEWYIDLEQNDGILIDLEWFIDREQLSFDREQLSIDLEQMVYKLTLRVILT